MFVFFSLLTLVLGQTECPTAPANPEDRRSNKNVLRVGTFNAEWLFPGNDGNSPWTTAQAEAHLIDVAAAIAKYDPDLLSIQEVQSCTMLARLILQLEAVHKLSGYKPYLVKGTDTATGQNVGFITRIDPVANVYRSADRYSYPISGNKCGSTSVSGTSAVSKHYVAKFNINGVPTTMFGQHFLAYPTDPARCVQREAQASVMRQLINTEITNNQEIIVFGDFNDYSDAVPDSSNDIPTSRVMNILRSGLVGGTLWNGTDSDPEVIVYSRNSRVPDITPKTPVETDMSDVSSTLIEICANVDQKERYTSAYDVTKVSQIDHILMSERISKSLLKVFIDHSYARETVSDHWPVYADISTPFIVV